MNDRAENSTQPAERQDFDDVMLAMDVVDTLRHRERVLDKELSAEERELKLVDRLREIYKNQGIDVPDRILKDGVKALEEKRFVYEPPKKTLSVRLAKLYINRNRWLKPLTLVLGLATFLSSIYYFGFERPQQQFANQQRIEITQTLPAQLTETHQKAFELAQTDNARTQIEAVYQNGLFAIEEKNASAARVAIGALTQLASDLSKDLTIRVVSRPGERSGVFRLHDDDPNVTNFYLIVEGVDASGQVARLRVTSEENQEIRTVSSWGVRVPQGEFNRVAADKQDDQIIQNAVIGQKQRGHLSVDYSIDTSGGAILEW